ncbi:MAG: hypothetical protein JW952_05880 [Candidatus Eisenbacteria bacterium]|nr:hypothetical protein [Candidatus Eisenbacteria bacterium]
MRRVSFWKVALALVLILINTVPGCTTRDKGTSPTAGRTTDEQSGLRVLPADAHDAILKQATADSRVESCRRMFESRRLGDRPASSFTVEGTNSDGAIATVTVMVFVGSDSTAAGVVALLRGNGESRVCAGVARTTDGSVLSETAPVALTEYAFRDGGSALPFEAVSVDTGGAGGEEGFWNCVGVGAVAGTTLCTLKCLPAGPAYAECLIACTGWAILSALVSCAFAELLGASD